jgi:Spy/CpxP family protein refolding chaperone
MDGAARLRPPKRSTETRRTVMHKTSKLIAVTAAALLIPAALLASRQASPLSCEPGALARRIAQKLDLTPDQIQQIRAVFAAHKAELAAELAAVKAARESQFDAIHAATYDEAAIRSAAAQVGQAETALAVTRGKLVSEIRPLLTPDQQAQAQQMLAAAKARVEGFLDKIRQRLQSDPLAGV